MKKIFKKAVACISAIVVAAIGTISVSAEKMTIIYGGYPLSYTVLDDKGMLLDDDYYKREDYKILYDGKYLYKAISMNNSFRFILNDNVVYEEVDDRVNEIFREYFPEEKSIEDYVPTISSRNFKNWNYRGTSYTVCLSKSYLDVLSDESVEQAKKQSCEMMKKLNDEGLISAFYDIGETYERIDYTGKYAISYKKTDDIDSVNAFLESDNKYKDYYVYIPVEGNYCRLECVLEGWEFTDLFSVAADIYEATGVAPIGFASTDLYQTVSGKNALEDLSDAIVPNSDMITLLGDLDLDEAIGITDIVLLSKYTNNSSAYPIADLSAFSNADVNWDGMVNSVDTLILIETSLGSFVGL